MKVFALGYSLLAISYAALWVVLPTLGLTSFLAVSAYHFGGDWECRGTMWTRFAYGSIVVTLPAVRHQDQVVKIFCELGATRVQCLVHASMAIAVIASAAGLIAAISQWKTRRADFFEVSGIIAAGIFLEPLLFFSCYFCLLHSPRHLLDSAKKVGLTRLRDIACAAGPVVLATVALAFGVWILLPPGHLDERLLRVIFVGLAALTLPHVLFENFVRDRNLLG